MRVRKSSSRPRKSLQRLNVLCGDKSPAKAVRKKLERKRADIEDTTAALRVLPADASKVSVSALVSNLQVILRPCLACIQHADMLSRIQSQLNFLQKQSNEEACKHHVTKYLLRSCMLSKSEVGYSAAPELRNRAASGTSCPLPQ